jgi:CheY-like chemotaxis protein
VETKDLLAELHHQFRRSFLDELPDRLADLRTQASAWSSAAAALGPQAEPRFDTFFRSIYNIKSSGMTFGLHLITAVCHQLEEFLQATVGGEIPVDASTAQISTTFIDLLEQAAAVDVSGTEGYGEIAAGLDALYDRLYGRRPTALVVIHSRLTRALCQEILARQGVRTVETTDSYLALQRVLAEPFTLLITSSELQPLRGEAIIEALKRSNKLRESHSILVTANPLAFGSHKRCGDPDYLLGLDSRLPDLLAATIAQILARLAKARHLPA